MWVEFVFGIVLWFDLPLLQNQLFEFSIRPGMVDEEQQSVDVLPLKRYFPATWLAVLLDDSVHGLRTIFFHRLAILFFM